MAKARITAEEAKFCLDLFKDEPGQSDSLRGQPGNRHDPKGDRNFLKQLDTYYIKRRYVEDLEAEVNSDEIIKFTVYIEGGAAESIYRQLPEMPGQLKRGFGRAGMDRHR